MFRWLSVVEAEIDGTLLRERLILFLVSYGQKSNKLFSNQTNVFEQLLASLRELKVCINLFYFSRSDFHCFFSLFQFANLQNQCLFYCKNELVFSTGQN